MKILNFFEIFEILNFKTFFFLILEFKKSVNLGRSGCYFFRIGKFRAQRVLILGINTRC